jgi:hypothetical protein
MSMLKLYKSYSFEEKDPVIDRCRTAIEDSGWSYSRISQESGVSTACLHEWFNGKTRRPQFATVAAVFSSLGYDLLPVARGSAKIVPIRARKAG